MTSKPKSSPDKELVKAFTAAGAVEYLEYLQSGKRIMWVNFRAGVAKGFGITIGMTVVLGVAVWVLTMLVDLPIIGEYFKNTVGYVTEYAENTNYKHDFAEMNQQLQDINENIKKLDSSESQ